MKKNIKLKNSSWTFSGKVAKSFDIHINKSVPFYLKMHELGLSIESGLGIAYNTHVNTCRPPSSPPLH